MIPNDPILITDPFDAICNELISLIPTISTSVKTVEQGWPDPKDMEQSGKLFPAVFIVHVSEIGRSMTSRNLIYKSITNADGSKNVYYERERITYLVQLTLATTDPQQRLDIGWLIKQYLINEMQLTINQIDTAKVVFKSDRMPPGRDNYYQRDIEFEISARVFDGEQVHSNKTIQSGVGVGTDSLDEIIEATTDIT